MAVQNTKKERLKKKNFKSMVKKSFFVTWDDLDADSDDDDDDDEGSQRSTHGIIII